MKNIECKVKYSFRISIEQNGIIKILRCDLCDVKTKNVEYCYRKWLYSATLIVNSFKQRNMRINLACRMHFRLQFWATARVRYDPRKFFCIWSMDHVRMSHATPFVFCTVIRQWLLASTVSGAPHWSTPHTFLDAHKTKFPRLLLFNVTGKISWPRVDPFQVIKTCPIFSWHFLYWCQYRQRKDRKGPFGILVKLQPRFSKEHIVVSERQENLTP